MVRALSKSVQLEVKLPEDSRSSYNADIDVV